jgi:hypothetical protein
MEFLLCLTFPSSIMAAADTERGKGLSGLCSDDRDDTVERLKAHQAAGL